MRNFPANFTTYKNRKDGVTPVWIMKFTLGGTIYYLSDMAIVVAPWGITTKKWVQSWGEVLEGISGTLDEFRVSDFSISVLTDPDASPNIEDLVLSNEIESAPFSLYLWFSGCPDAPQEIWRGYAKDVEIPDETRVEISLQDESLRLDRAMIGTKVTLEAYPSADPDDIGKVIPIPFGAVKKLPALAVSAGVSTTLPADISKTTPTFSLTSGDGISAGMVILIDSENILIGAVTGDEVSSCTRGYNGTVPATHSKGATVWEKKLSFDYLVSAVPVASIPKVYGAVGESILDITSFATVYTGQAGDEHPSYPGKAVVTLPGYVTVEQGVTLAISTVVVDQGSHTHTSDDQFYKTTFNAVANPATSWWSTDGESYWGNGVDKSRMLIDGVTTTLTQAITAGATSITVANASSLNTSTLIVIDSENILIGSISGNTLNGCIRGCNGTTAKSHSIGASVYTGAGGASGAWNVPHNDNLPGYSIRGDNFGASARYYLDTAPSVNGTPIEVKIGIKMSGAGINGSSSAFAFYVGGVLREIIIPTQPGVTVMSGAYEISSWSELVSNGSDGSGLYVDYIVTGNNLCLDLRLVAKYGTAAVPSAPATGVTVTQQPELQGNSVANTLVGDRVLCDVVANISSINDVFNWLLSEANYAGIFSMTGGPWPASYTVNGAITEYRSALAWLNELAFQLRAWFKPARGAAQLIYRPDVLASVKTLAHCRLSGGKKVHSRKKTDYEEILNTVAVLYGRDWTKDKGADGYQATATQSDTDSIAIYGARERPDLFQFDFVTSADMAADLCAFYLAWYAVRHWLHEFDTFLYDCELEFGDGVTLGFAGDLVGQVLEARHSPGDSSTSDKIGMVVVV